MNGFNGNPLFVPVPELDAWIQSHRNRIYDEIVSLPDFRAYSHSAKIEKALAPLRDASLLAENVSAFRRIVNGQRARIYTRIDRQLAKRTDAIGDLFRRAPAAKRLETQAVAA